MAELARRTSSVSPTDGPAIEAMVERVVISRNRFTIILSRDAGEQLDRERIDVDWSPAPTRPKRQILAPTDKSSIPKLMESPTRQTLIAAIARGRLWVDELVKGSSGIEVIAAREKRSARSVQKIISLAFLSPKIVQAAIDGTLPRGLSMTRLFDLPADWTQQHKAIGID